MAGLGRSWAKARGWRWTDAGGGGRRRRADGRGGREGRRRRGAQRIGRADDAGGLTHIHAQTQGEPERRRGRPGATDGPARDLTAANTHQHTNAARERPGWHTEAEGQVPGGPRGARLLPLRRGRECTAPDHKDGVHRHARRVDPSAFARQTARAARGEHAPPRCVCMNRLPRRVSRLRTSPPPPLAAGWLATSQRAACTVT